MMMTQADDRRTASRFFSEEDLQVETPSNGLELVGPEDSVATTKEEEWVTKKKIELTTTRQIETRVKRQVVLEDGKVVEDTGPLVTTSTTEDTEKQEHSQTEHRTLGDEDGVTQWSPALHAGDHVKEVQESTVKSREEKEERTETEKVRHLGDLSDEGYLTAIKSGSDDVREALQVSDGKELIETAPKVIHQSLKIRKYVDSEDKSELSRIQPGGKIINETRTTRLHEEVNDCNVSDEDEHSSEKVDLYEMTRKENSEKYRKTKEQDFTEYLANGKKIGEKLHFQAETSEAERRGGDLGCNDDDDDDDDYYYYTGDHNRNTVASRLKRIKMRAHKSSASVGNERFPTFKRPSNFDHEEEARKEETSKWLEHHFGSESTRSSKASLDDLDDVIPSTQNSFINVTMKSQLNAARRQEAFPTSKEVTERAGRESSFSTEKEPFSNMRIRNLDDEENRSRMTDSVFHGMKRDLCEADRLSTAGDSCELDSEDCYLHEARSRRKRLPVQSHATYLGSHSDRFTRSDETFSPDEVKAIQTIDNEFKPGSQERAATKDVSPSSRSPSSKKLYQRTRFAADIPPPPQSKDPRQPVKGKSKFGDGFRKLMDKLRSTSNERKNKKRSRGNESRSPSPKENTYQNYNSLDNYGSQTAENDQYCEKGDFQSEDPVPPPRTRHLAARPRLSPEPKSLQRYYLGEDPFAVSIYGREKEYGNGDAVPAIETRGLTDSEGENEFKARTLGRLSKSTSRLATTATSMTTTATIPTNNTSSQKKGGVQTLPRTLYGNKKTTKKNSEKRDVSKELGNGAWQVDRWEHIADTKPMTHARSLINVSFVNRPLSPFHWISRTNEVTSACQGPAKPARTYRSNLLRSQSFNVQPRQEAAFPLRSAPLPPRGLQHSPPPLESPGMIHQWTRHRHQSEEDRPSLGGSRAVHGTLPKPTRRHLGGDRVKCVDHSSSFRSTSTANTSDSRSTPDGYQGYAFKSERPLPGAPRVFTRTFHNGNVVQTVSTSETSGKDDYSETVRIESKSNDPLSPSETNTVKIFSKKKIPSREGHGYETIESSETKTVVKSHGLRTAPTGGSRLQMARSVGPPGGIVIKVKAP